MFGRYADVHLDRAVPPATTMAVNGLARVLPWRKVSAWGREILKVRAYLRGRGKGAPRSEVEQRVHAHYEAMLASVDLGLAPDVMRAGADYVVNQVDSSWATADAGMDGDAPGPSPI